MFRALMIEKDDTGQRAAVRSVDDATLGAGEVTVNVEYSTINYKDGLAITGQAPVVRKFPLVAGIDFAGVDLGAAFEREVGGHAVAQFFHAAQAEARCGGGAAGDLGDAAGGAAILDDDGGVHQAVERDGRLGMGRACAQ